MTRGSEHFTITEAHPFHGPNQTEAFDANCPKCRQGKQVDRYTGLRNAVIDMLAAADLVTRDETNRKVTRHLNKLIAADVRLALALEAAPTFTDPGHIHALQQIAGNHYESAQYARTIARVALGELGAGALLGDFGQSLMEESVAEDRANSERMASKLDAASDWAKDEAALAELEDAADQDALTQEAEDVNDEPPPDVGPPGSGAIITEYVGNEPGVMEDDVRWGTPEEQGEAP